MRNRLTDELAVCGLNAALAVAENSSEQINRLFLREDRLVAFSQICKSLAERKRPYKICDDEELERICKSTHHQGVVAMILLPDVQPLTREDIDQWAQEGSAGVVLHALGNDHNLGAIVRSAAFFDFKYVVIAGKESESEDDDEGVKLSTSAYRVAEGGMEHVTVRSVRNTAAFLRSASRDLLTIGTDIRARQRIGDIGRIAAERQKGGVRPAIALVIGNEETGLPPQVKSACAALVRIPGTGLMESLNAAQAATLFMQRIFEI